MTETKGPDLIQLALQKAQKIQAEIQKGEINKESQPIIEKFERIYQFEQKYPPQKEGVLGAKETITDEDKQIFAEWEKINKQLKDNLGNFVGFVYSNWKNKNHPESENTSPYGDKSVDTVKNPSMIGKKY